MLNPTIILVLPFLLVLIQVSSSRFVYCSVFIFFYVINCPKFFLGKEDGIPSTGNPIKRTSNNDDGNDS